MSSPEAWWALQLALFLALLLGSGFFSGSETALFGITPVKRKSLERRGDAAAAAVVGLLRRPRALLISILIGNTFVNVALSALGTTLADGLVGGGQGLGLTIFGVTAALLIAGEVLPKVLAVRFGEAFSLAVGPRLARFHAACGPLTRRVERLTQALLARLPGVERPGEVGRDELVTLLKIGEEGGAIDAGEAGLVQAILALEGAAVREVMTPRVELKAVADDLDDAALRAALRGFKRRMVPLFGEDLDDLRGLLRARDWLFAPPGTPRDGFVVTPLFVPEGKSLADLLAAFRDRGERLAVVLDEYGGVAGLVSLEDILEEIFGEAQDRLEGLGEDILPVPGGFDMPGDTPLDDLERVLGIDLEAPEREELTTLAGLLMGRLGRLPRRGDRVRFAGWEFTVERILHRRVVAVAARRHDPPAAAGEGAA